MADSKISALPASTTPLAGTEVLPIVQGGTTKQVSVANLTVGRAVGSAGGTFTDNFIQGTASKGVNYTANSAAAGMTSQLLNFYEEGTFSFTLLGGTGTFTSQTNRYTKIGRTVMVNFDITINAISGSGADTLVGLPYNSLAGTAYAGSIGYFSNAANLITFPGVYASTTTLYLVGLSVAGSSVSTWNALGNGTRITGTIVYATT